MKYSFIRALTAIALSAILSACGGGGGDSSNSEPSQTAANQAQVTIQSDPYVAVGSTATLTWSNNQSKSCTGSGQLIGPLASSGTQTITFTQAGSVSYGVNCGGAVANATVTVLPEYSSVNDGALEAAFVKLGIDDQVDGRIKTANALAVKKLEIHGQNYETPSDVLAVNVGVNAIHDLSGLSAFRNLLRLVVEQQAATSFDATPFTELAFLSLWQVPITAIDLSHNLKLTTLGLSEDSLTQVDVSMLSQLSDLEIQQCDPTTCGTGPAPYVTSGGVQVKGFSALDVSHNPKLTNILMQGNRVTSLDLSHNLLINGFNANYNQLQSVKIDHLQALAGINLSHNQLSGSLDIRGTSLDNSPTGKSLWIDGNSALTQVSVNNLAKMQTWCASAIHSYDTASAPSFNSNGYCIMDMQTQFVQQ